MIKLSSINNFLPIFLYLKYFKDLNLEIFKVKFLFIYILFITFFIQQFIYTGCLLFPSNLTCLNVSWFNEDSINLSNNLKLINKSYFGVAKVFLSPEEYLRDFNWFSYWFKRNFIEFTEHLLTMIIPILLFLFFQKEKVDDKLFLHNKFELYIFLVLGLLFWLNFSPVYRFAIHLFLTFVFLLFIDNLISRNFSKKIFIFFVITFISFSFTKNIIRLSKNENIFLGVLKVDNQFILDEKNNNEFIKVYRPDIKKNSTNGWQGRLCWNTPFICSYNILDVKKKNGYLIINKLIN